jgi:drug/metabolite transporter (DMT)-like permease
MINIFLGIAVHYFIIITNLAIFYKFMLLFSLIIIGSISLGLWSTFSVRLIEDGKREGLKHSSTFVLGGSFLAASFYLFVFWLVLWNLGFSHFSTDINFWFPLVITVILNVLFEIARFRAYSLSPLGKVAPFQALSPALSVFFAWLILGELPTLGGGLGIFLVVISIYLLNFSAKFNWKNIFSPFRSIWTDLGVRLAFLASLPPALSIVFDKKAVIASDPIFFSLVAFFLIGLSSWLVDYLIQGRKEFKAEFRLRTLKGFFRTGFLHFVAVSCFNVSLLLAIVPYVSALRRLTIIFEIIFGYLILKQKDDIKKRLLVGLGVVIGAIIIAFFR